MELHKRDIRAWLSAKIGTPLIFVSLTVLFLSCLKPQLAAAQEPHIAAKVAQLSTQQVVEELTAMNLKRAKALRAYEGSRTYTVKYRGFPSSRNAEMVVDVTYHAPGTKAFTIRSETGSQLMIDKVLKRLLQAEQEASAAAVQRLTALTKDNYDFTLDKYESKPVGSMYVLTVKPRTANKFLYRGRIWVDAKDFAVVRLEAEPSKNPSFWIRNSKIELEYSKVGDFWFPALNHTITATRLGGQAELTIEYSVYHILTADAAGNSPTLEADTTGSP